MQTGWRTDQLLTRMRWHQVSRRINFEIKIEKGGLESKRNSMAGTKNSMR